MPFITQETLSKTFLARIQATPGRIGFEYKAGTKWRQVTFLKFYEECRVLSFSLMGLGVAPGDKVALLSSTRYEWPLADMAILGAGAVTVPIYPSVTSDDVAYIIEHSEAVVAILENLAQLKKLIDRKREKPESFTHLKKIILIETSQEEKKESRNPSTLFDAIDLTEAREMGRREEANNPKRFDQNLRSAKPSDLITICYTSGTTGTPKGAMLTHDNMMSVLEDCVSILRKRVNVDEEVLLSYLPFSHILGKLESVSVYTFGWREAFAENLESLPRNFLEVRPTVIFTVPRIFEKAFERIHGEILKRPRLLQKLFEEALESGENYFRSEWTGRRRQLPNFHTFVRYQLADRLVFKRIREGFGGRLKFAVCGGAPLPEKIGKFFDMVGIRIIEGYGLTETCAPVTLNSLERPRFGAVGKPLPEVALKIDTDGEILVRSRKIFSGYYKMPAETDEVMKKGWFHTGDIGVLDDEGVLRITDRKKDIIVTSGGKNIAPQKIENMARDYKLINQFVVHGDRRNYLTALVALDRNEAIRFANENDILFSEYPELIKHPKIRTKVQQVLDEINGHLANFETIKKFIILPNDFTVESGELTPSLKIRRKVINEHYKSQLNSMYGGTL